MTWPVAAQVAPTTAAREISTYVPMKDGVRIAVDVLQASSSGVAPTVVQVTRYGRGGRDPQMTEAWRAKGFNQVFVDARGTGASFGARPIEFYEVQTGDLEALVAWITAQPWSNGALVFTGNSYAGDLAEWATALSSPAMKGAVIRHSEYDVYRHLTYPGGVRNQVLLDLWGRATGEADLSEACLGNPAACAGQEHLKPVEGDEAFEQLRLALKDHQQNFRADRDLIAAQFSDDAAPSGRPLSSMSASSRSAAVGRAALPVQVWASWLDAGTAASALERFQTLPGPAELVIGPWSHGGSYGSDPFSLADQGNAMARGDQIASHTGFAWKAVTGGKGGRFIRYWPLGGQAWRQTPSWPPKGVSPRRFYLDSGARLSAHAGRAGSDLHPVDFTASTGKANRWRTQLDGGRVIYSDRAEADRKLAVYETQAFEIDQELAGRVKVRLRLSADRPDGAVFAYLEDVGPTGVVTYLTEGQLRLVHRKPGPNLDDEPSYSRADALPVTPGEVMDVTVLLAPVAAKIAKGHRLRLALGGADADTFARYPQEGPLNLTLHRDPQNPSWVEAPLRPWTGQ